MCGNELRLPAEKFLAEIDDHRKVINNLADAMAERRVLGLRHP